MDSNGWVCVCVRDAILDRNNYCTKPNPKSNSHSGSWVHNVLGAQSLQITLKYDLVNKILTGPLTQPVVWEMGSSIFAAMTKLKVATATSASLPIIPSTERKTDKYLSFGCNRPAHACPSWVSPNLSTTYPSWMASKNPRQYLQTWCQ